MALLPQSLAQYAGRNAKLAADAEDTALVKMGTLKGWIAKVIGLIPNPGAGIAVRRTPQGDVWNVGVTPTPFQISSQGKVYPGLVGTLMPTLEGEPLDTTSKTLDLTANDGNFYVWLTIHFTPTYASGWLSYSSMDSVTVDSGTSIPSDTDSVKHLQINTITGQAPTASFFTTSIPVQLKDNGLYSTLITYTGS